MNQFDLVHRFYTDVFFHHLVQVITAVRGMHSRPKFSDIQATHDFLEGLRESGIVMVSVHDVKTLLSEDRASTEDRQYARQRLFEAVDGG